MRGFFGVGVEGISKPGNIGAIARSAHSFGASFFFTINPDIDPVEAMDEMRTTDTSASFNHVPYYEYNTPGELLLPKGCQLVGVEFVEDSITLPSFRHPQSAAYILGPEMGSLSPEIMKKCDHIIKIPMKFCVNVSVAAAIVLYDRTLSMGGFQDRPVKAGGPPPAIEMPNEKVHRRKLRTLKKGVEK